MENGQKNITDQLSIMDWKLWRVEYQVHGDHFFCYQKWYYYYIIYCILYVGNLGELIFDLGNFIFGVSIYLILMGRQAIFYFPEY